MNKCGFVVSHLVLTCLSPSMKFQSKTSSGKVEVHETPVAETGLLDLETLYNSKDRNVSNYDQYPIVC